MAPKPASFPSSVRGSESKEINSVPQVVVTYFLPLKKPPPGRRKQGLAEIAGDRKENVTFLRSKKSFLPFIGKGLKYGPGLFWSFQGFSKGTFFWPHYTISQGF